MACVSSVSANKFVRKKAVGKWCSLYGAEEVAMDEALELVRERSGKEVVFIRTVSVDEEAGKSSD